MAEHGLEESSHQVEIAENLSCVRRMQKVEIANPSDVVDMETAGAIEE